MTEAVNYRRWDGRSPGFTREGGDRVVILEDTDRDGRCDSSKVFVQDPELVAPLGILVVDLWEDPPPGLRPWCLGRGPIS